MSQVRISRGGCWHGAVTDFERVATVTAALLGLVRLSPSQIQVSLPLF